MKYSSKRRVKDALLKRASEVSIGSRVASDGDDALGDSSSPVGRFVDTVVLFVAIKELQKVLDEKLLTDQSSAEAHLIKGVQLARRYLSILIGGLKDYIEPHFSEAALKPLERTYLIISKPGSGFDQILGRGEFLSDIFARLVSRQQLLRAICPDSRSLMAARQIGQSVGGTPQETLQKLGAIRNASKIQILRKWVEQAASVAGKPVDPIISTIADVGGAKELGTQLRTVEVQISNADPVRAEELEVKRDEIVAEIKELASGSVNPQAVITQAAVAATPTAGSFATETGRSVGLNPQQEDAMMVRGKSVIAAGAGSGKTRVLAAKVVYTIKELGAAPNQIIATSFSRKSAAELIERIKKYGGDLDDKEAMDGFGTTHSIATKLINKFSPKSQFQEILQGGKQTSLIKMAMNQVKMTGGGPPPDANQSFFPTVGALGPAAIAPGQTPDVEQTPDVTPDPATPVDWATAIKYSYEWFERARPSGWTDWSLRFLKDMKRMDPSRLSIKQKDVLKKIFKQSGVDFKIASMHTAAPPGGGAKVPEGWYWKNPANQWFNLGVGDEGFKDPQGRAIGPKRFMLSISKWKANLTTPGQAWGKDPGSLFAAVYGAYEWLKDNDPKNGGRDHDDTLIEASRLLIGNPRMLAQNRGRFKYIFVDEAQDLNKAQHLLFGLLSGYYDPATQQPNLDGKMTADTYCFIGDDKQAIYEFRGADPNVFVGLSDLRPGGQNFTTKLLDTNYRSGKAIVDAANQLMEHNKEVQIPMTCKSNVERKGAGQISWISVPNHEAAGAFAAQQIEDLTKGDSAVYSYKDFGVAVRTNAEAYAFGVELLKRGIPFRAKINLFNDTTTKALIHWLNLAEADINDKKTINEIVLNSYKAPRFNLDKMFDKRLGELARGANYMTWLLQGGWQKIYQQDFRNKYVYDYAQTLKKVKSLTGKPSEVLEAVLNLEGAYLGGKRQSIIDALIEETKSDPEAMDLLASETESGVITDDDVKALALAPIQPLMSLVEAHPDLGPCMTFIKKLQKANEKNGKSDDPNAPDYKEPAVVIDTCHGWKGLEAKHMYVPMAAGVFPHANSEGDKEQMFSERRLGYVALTRGEDSVTVLCPEVSHVGRPAGPSQFVSEACISGVTDLAEEKIESVVSSAIDEEQTWFNESWRES